MDVVRELGRSALVAVAGVALVVAALSESLAIGPVDLVPVKGMWPRVALGVLGAALLASAGVLLYAERRRAPSQPVPNAPALQTLDSLPGLDEELLDGTRRLSILARTGVNIVSSYERSLQEACANGCEVRLLMVDPDSPSARHLYGQNYEMYLNNLRSARGKLEPLMQTIGPRLQVRLTSDSPAFSAVIFDRQDSQGRARIQLNFMRARLGRDRPVLVVEEDDQWFAAFVDEFEQMWHDARVFSA